MTQRHEFIERLERRLRELEDDIDKLKTMAGQATADARAGIDAQVRQLKERRRTLEARMDEIREAGDDAWEDLKAGADAAWDAMELAMKSAIERFRGP
ncbi:MAG: hypothetical protein AAFX58_02935 [Pseudomonadota bacterium]